MALSYSRRWSQKWKYRWWIRTMCCWNDCRSNF